MSKIQLLKDKLIDLMEEVHIICKNNDINYFLVEEALVAAIKNLTLPKYRYTFSVAIYSEDVEKFCDIVSNISGRKVESPLNNSQFPGFYMRYVDTSTTFYDASVAKQKYENSCIGINIYVLFDRPQKNTHNYYEIIKNRIKRKYAMLISKKKTGVRGSALNLIARLMHFDTAFKESLTQNKKTSYVAMYTSKGEQIVFKRSLFGKGTDILVDKKIFRVPDNMTPVAKSTNHNKLVLSKKNSNHVLDKRYIINFSCPGIELINVLKKDVRKLKRDAYRYKKYLKWCDTTFAKVWSKREEYYRPYFLTKDRFLFYDKLCKNNELKNQIIDFYENNNYERLIDILRQYTHSIAKYNLKGYGIYFDKEIYIIAMSTLFYYYSTRNSEQISDYKIKRLIKNIDYIPWQHIQPLEDMVNGEKYCRDDAEAVRKEVEELLIKNIDSIKKYGEDWMTKYRFILKECNESDIGKVLDYIGDDKLLCFYLYMDVLECGIEDEGLGLWVSECNDDIHAVMYQYYDCLHIFSRKKDVPVNNVIKLIKQIHPKVIVSSENVIDTLKCELDQNEYMYELNHIITTDVLMKENDDISIASATKKDVPEIAEMMMKDPIYNSVYTYEKLCGDLVRRFETGFGRMFVIRDENNKLVCANATYAETDDLAVIGGLVTDPASRGKGLGAAITANTWNAVLREGKRGLAFLLDGNDKTINLHKKLGYDFIGTSARLIRKD